jgi:peptidoglycan/LPS O-acetylase OafA/YrhL
MKKIRYLDGLRGVAAFEVVFHHFILAFYPAMFSGPGILTHFGDVEVKASGSFLNLFWDGNFSVCIFFVLSGYVLSHKFFLHPDSEIITESVVKRYFRLALPVSFSVLFAYVLLKFSMFYNLPVGEMSDSGWFSSLWNFVPDFVDALRQGFVGTFFTNIFDYNTYNTLLWTISVEFIGSFLVFSFLAVFGKVAKRFWAYAFLILVFSWTYYLAFVLGMMLSDAIANRQAIIGKIRRRKTLLASMGALGLFLGSYPIGRDPQGTFYAFMNFSWPGDPAVLWHVLGAFLLMVVLLESARVQKIFSLRPILFLGKISFTMYLLHLIILGSFSSFVFLKLLPILGYNYSVLSSFLISLPVIFLLSYLMYVYVDKKAVNLSHRIYELMFREKVV